MLQLPRFMVAMTPVAVNHDGQGGTAPDSFVWDQEVGPSSARSRLRFLTIWLPFPNLRFFLRALDSGQWWMHHGSSFLGSFHWLGDAGEFGAPWRFLFEQWAGHRLLSEKVTRPHVRCSPPNFYFFRPCYGRN